MTSAPVKSANSLATFTGSGSNVQLPKAGTDDRFGNAMNKASGQSSNLKNDYQVTNAKRSGKSKHAELSQSMKKSRQADSMNGTECTTSMKEWAQEIDEACQKMKDAVSEILQVTEEEVQQAMETLGLGMTDLLNSANLSQLVLAINGEADASSLLTDEALFGQLQALNEIAGELRDDFMQIMNFSGEELDAALADAKSFLETAMNEAQEKNSEEGSGITVEVDQGGKTVELITDENGNVMNNGQTITGEEAASTNDGKEHGDGEKNGEHSSEDSMSSQNLTYQMQQNEVSATETTATEATSSFSSNTQEIMDQILSNIKIQLKPGMDSLQMQLHPESLGTVHVQLLSKAGEVTAQFHVQNEAVKAVVESQMMVLKESLNEQGVRVEAIEVSVDTRGFESNLWQGQESPSHEAYEKQRKSPRRINLTQLNPDFEEEADEDEVLAAEMMRANGNTVDFTA